MILLNKQIKHYFAKASLFFLLSFNANCGATEELQQELENFKAETFTPWYEAIKTDTQSSAFLKSSDWMGQFQRWADTNKSNLLILSFLLNHDDCQITPDHLWQELEKHIHKDSAILRFMLTESIPEKYKLSRDLFYPTRGFIRLSTQNISDLIAHDMGPKTEEESTLLYLWVYAASPNLSDVDDLFANLATLLPLLPLKTLQDSQELKIKQVWGTGLFEHRDLRRRGYLIAHPELTKRPRDEPPPPRTKRRRRTP